MRRYRNARYAPESLERKLSPSAGLAPAPAVVEAPADFVMAPVGDNPAGYGFGGPDTSINYSTEAFPAGCDAPAWAAGAYGDMLAANDGDVPPPPSDAPPTDLPPIVPSGPVVPAYA